MSGDPRSLERSIDVEPLAESRWARIEHALFDAERRVWAPDSAGPAPPVGARGVAALVLAAALAVVVGALGVRSLQPAAGTPTRVETAANGSHVEFGESTVDVGPESSVRLVGDDARGVLVIVDRGRVECEVTPRRGRPPFLVQAGAVEVKVIGTHFTVVRTGSKATVDVQHGQVEVTTGDGTWRVAAGAHWPSPDPAAPEATAPAASSEAAPAPAAAPWVAPAAATSTSTSTPASSWSATSSPRPAPAPHAALTPRARYEAASRLEATDPDAALAQYRELARHGGSWGQNALFAAGRLDADRGNRDEAERLLAQYLSLYPSGANANDARELLHRMR
jgi:hypothetical protein